MMLSHWKFFFTAWHLENAFIILYFANNCYVVSTIRLYLGGAVAEKPLALLSGKKINKLKTSFIDLGF